MNGLLYSALVLHTHGTRYDLDVIFKADATEVNNHLYPYEANKAKSFDYIQAGKGAEFVKRYVSTRGIQIVASRIGEVLATDAPDNTLQHVVQNILAINSVSTEEEQQLNSYLQLAYSKVYSKITKRSLLNIDMKSSQPKYLLMTKDIPVYFLVAMNDVVTYLLWSNESELEKRVREKYGEKFYFYRLPTYDNGICVIQSRFLEKRFNYWRRTMRDNLKVMNALESHLNRRWIVPVQTDGTLLVNDSTGTDHPSVPLQHIGS